MVEPQQQVTNWQSSENFAISNAEVKLLLGKQIKDQLANPGGMGAFCGNEHSSELRQQTLQYLELFNEFDEPSIITEIRR